MLSSHMIILHTNMATIIPPPLLLYFYVPHTFGHSSFCLFLTYVPPLYAFWANIPVFFGRLSTCGPGVWFSFWEGKYLQCKGEPRGAGPGLNRGVCHLPCNPPKLEYTRWPTSARVRSSGWMRCRGVCVCVCVYVCVCVCVCVGCGGQLNPGGYSRG